MKNNKFKEIWEKLKSSEKILIPLHPKPDGDSLGASTAMKYVLEKNTPAKVKVISQDDLSKDLKEFKFSEEVEFNKKITDFDLKEFDIILFLDHGTLKGHSEKIEEKKFPENLKVINIDHHKTNSYFGNMNYINEKIPSCCSILVNLFKEIKIDFDKEISKRLLLGICTDTGFFIHGDSLDSLKKAVFLIEKGNLNYLKDFYGPLNSYSWNVKKLHGILLINMKKKKIEDKIVAYSYVTKDQAKEHDLNLSELRLGIISMQNIKNSDIIFTLTDLGEKIKGSFRSKNIDTSLFAEKLGGGGHKGASAFYLEKMPIKKAIEKVLKTIKETGMNPA